MSRIYQIHTAEDRNYVRELFWEYLQDANSKVDEEFGVNFDIKTMLEQDMLDLEKFYPPDGCLLLENYENQVIGLACMRRIGGSPRFA
ncbi:MAG: hypothetical protein V3W18_10820 [candidate division Zixibacteria bacterium]